LIPKATDCCKAGIARTGGMTMLTHSAEYFRQRRRAQGIPARDPFSAPKFLRLAVELQRLEQLTWPTNLFGQPATIAELIAGGVQLARRRGKDHDQLCPWGAARDHR
jgi:hypothetical protein